MKFEWAGQGVRFAGTALHGFLQRIAREGLEAWDESAVKSRRDLYRTALANLGVPPGELGASAAERVEAGLLQTLRDPRGRWILEAHPDAECEFSIAGLIDGQARRGRDRPHVRRRTRRALDHRLQNQRAPGRRTSKRFSTTSARATRNNWNATRGCCSPRTSGRSASACIFRCWADGASGPRRWSCEGRQRRPRCSSCEVALC